MNISIVTGPWLPVPAILGGSTGRSWNALAREFAKAGHNPTIVACKHRSQPDYETVSGVVYQRVTGACQTGNIVLDLAKDFFYALKTLPQLPEADVTVFHDFWLPAVSLLRRRSLGKTVLFVGRMPKKQHWLYPSIDSFIVPNESIRNALKEQQSRIGDRTKVVPYPVDDTFYCRSSVSGSGVLYVGRIHPEKGLALLIEATKRLCSDLPEQQLSLTIIGPHRADQGGGGEQYFEHLKYLAKDLPVHFFPAEYDQAKLKEHYQRAAIFVYPSLAEGGETFGVAPAEAMACGTVPIVSDLDCFKGHIKHGKSGFIFNHRAKDPATELTGLLKELFENDSLYERVASNAARDAESFRPNNIASLYLEIFSEWM